jgi:hypothetical protein
LFLSIGLALSIPLSLKETFFKEDHPMSRWTRNLVLAYGLIGVGLLWGQTPGDLESPYMAPGEGEDYLRSLSLEEGGSRSVFSRHGAFVVLESLGETKGFLGTPLAKSLQAEMESLLYDDLVTAAWADIY